MKNWHEALVSPTTTIHDAMRMLTALQIALVVDDSTQLLGTVTDGDVRRGILRGVALDAPVQDVMNPRPTTSKLGDGREQLLATMKRLHIHHIPIVDDDGRVIGVELLD